jgi:hypothetical protein
MSRLRTVADSKCLSLLRTEPPAAGKGSRIGGRCCRRASHGAPRTRAGDTATARHTADRRKSAPPGNTNCHPHSTAAFGYFTIERARLHNTTQNQALTDHFHHGLLVLLCQIEQFSNDLRVI